MPALMGRWRRALGRGSSIGGPLTSAATGRARASCAPLMPSAASSPATSRPAAMIPTPSPTTLSSCRPNSRGKRREVANEKLGARMQLYDCATAPSPRRVRMFLAEKGMSIPTRQVDLRGGEHLRPAFRAINADATVPVLVLEDGSAIADAVAICCYLEELQPEPALIGSTARERALTIACNRQLERDGFYAVMEAFRNSTPGLKGRALPGPNDYEQSPALAERGRARVNNFFAYLDRRLAVAPYVAGERYTIADITAFITVEFAARAKLPVPPSCPYLTRWVADQSARASAKA